MDCVRYRQRVAPRLETAATAATAADKHAHGHTHTQNTHAVPAHNTTHDAVAHHTMLQTPSTLQSRTESTRHCHCYCCADHCAPRASRSVPALQRLQL